MSTNLYRALRELLPEAPSQVATVVTVHAAEGATQLRGRAGGYGVGFGLDQYADLAGLMRTIKGKAIVSVNDIPEMRQAFKGLEMRKLPIAYSLARSKDQQESTELVIANFDLPKVLRAQD